MKNTTFDNNFANFSLNVIKFGMLIDNIESGMSHDFALIAMETILAANYEFLHYQNVCIYKLGCRNGNILASVLHCISLERAGHHHSNKVCRICTAAIYGLVCDNIHMKCHLCYTF